MVSSNFPTKPCMHIFPPNKNVDVSPPIRLDKIIPLISSTDHEAAPYAVFPAPLLSRLSQIIYNKIRYKQVRNIFVKTNLKPINQILCGV
jgi:hypothetical protein